MALNAKPGTAILAAVETTVRIIGGGWGGRNQHLVLPALKYLQKGQVIISVDSDGIDHSQFAGGTWRPNYASLRQKEKAGIG